MNTTIKVYMTIFILIMTFASVQAQERMQEWMNRPATERAEVLTNWMDEELELSEEQRENSYGVNLKYAQKGNELNASSASRREKFQTMKQLSADKDKELQEIFTEEQYKRYQDKKDGTRELMKENRSK